jgi:prevent-host-death family protein
MGAVWQLQETKNKLSEVIHHAQTEGPQEITRLGKKTAVVIAFK